MTTNHHTAVATGAAANAATINGPLAELDAAINDRISLPALDFGSVNGTPVKGELGNAAGVKEAATWKLGDSTTDSVGAGPPVTTLKAGSTIAVDLFWAMESAVSGDVRLSVTVDSFTDTEDFSIVGGSEVAAVRTVPGTVKTVTRTTITVTVTYGPSEVLRFRIARTGADGLDTATGELHFMGALVRFL